MSAQKRARRPLSRRIQARMMGIVNVPMRWVLALRFATPLGNRLMLVYLTGRKTRRSYRQPVSYVRYGGDLLTPPLASIACPVIQRASSEARKATTSAMSAASPMRPNAMVELT
jgi:hypothetical protein